MKFKRKPLFIRFDITDKCNLHCKACYRLSKRIKDLSKTEVFKVIDEVNKFGVNRILLGGGDPFLRHDLEEILIYTNQKGINCDIVSNGTLIRKTNLKFIKRYVSDLSISLDGHNEKLNSKIRPKSSFKKVIRALHLLKKNRVEFNLITTLSKKNLDYFEEIINFSKKIGAKEHHFVRFIPIGYGSKYKDWYIPDEEWLNVVKRLKQDARLLFDEKYITSDCGAGKEFLCVLSNGNITICTRKYSQKCILGNILKDNIDQIWKASFLLKKAQATRKADCLTCNY